MIPHFAAKRIGWVLTLGFLAGVAEAKTGDLRGQVIAAARTLLDTANVSYVYGGSELGEQGDCTACNACLDKAKPKPAERLVSCPVCQSCSLDCSHFTQLVYKTAGLNLPYLPTALMIGLSKQKLLKSYHLRDLGTDLSRSEPGDWLVYDGHVVLLEQKLGAGLGDIIHATSGREIRGGGQGIQRVRRVALATFHGPLRRILRHQKLDGGLGKSPKVSRTNARLRPINP